MGDLRRALLNAQDVLTGIGGDLEMMIEEEPGKNTPANRLRLKNVLAINDLLERAIKLATRANV